MSTRKVLARLREEGDPEAIKELARFGISAKSSLGVPVPVLRRMAKDLGRDHGLASELWKSGIHEAKILAAMTDDPRQVTEGQMEAWVANFDSWDVCDQCCGNLFDRTPYAFGKALEWSKRKEEFVRRAGYVLMAELAVHDKKMSDEEFLKFFDALRRGAADERNFVKKAVSWAIRQMGKRNLRLNVEAVKLAREIGTIDSKSAKWVASDAIRELTGEGVRKRLRRSS